MPEIVAISALSVQTRAIGIENKLPWHLPEDLKRFKRLTKGHPMIMGRLTFESLVEEFGGPLKGRRHLVLSRTPQSFSHPAAEVFGSPGEALAELADEERIFIAGGASIYRLFLEHCDRLELTLVEGQFEADTFFPAYEHLVGKIYDLVAYDQRAGFRFETYFRRNGPNSKEVLNIDVT